MKGRYLCCICLPLLLIFALAGIYDGDAEQDAASLPVEEGQVIGVSGTVYRQEFKSSYQSIYLKNISFLSLPENKTAFGTADIQPETGVLAYLKTETDIAVGARAVVQGEAFLPRPAGNPGGFDAKAYYRSKGIGLILKKAQIQKRNGSVWPLRNRISLLRRRFAQTLQKLTDGETAGILCAVILGDRGGLETGIKDLYQDTGLIHLFSVSGLHITILGMGLFRLLRKTGLSIKPAACLCAAFMLCYVYMTGMAYPAVRAMIMFSFYLLAALTGRTYDLATALASAAAVMLFCQREAAPQAGFLLSFSAVAGVMLAGRWKAKRLRGTALGSSIGIQLVTVPLTAYFYYKIPLYACFINLLVLPFMPFVLGFGIAGMMAGLVSQTAGKIILSPAFYILKAIKYLCEAVSCLPFSSIITGKPTVMRMAAYYLLLFAGFFFSERKRKESSRPDLSKLAFAMILLSGIMLPSGKRNLRMTFLDVGQGDGCCIENGRRSVWMVDGGSSSESALARYCLEPFLNSIGTGYVDCWMISHYDMDHVSGLMEILEGYSRNMAGHNRNGISIGRIFLPDIADDSQIHKKICALAKENGIPVFYVSSGDVFREGAMTVRVLAPEKDKYYSSENAASMVTEVSYSDFKALLTGDMEKDGEESFAAKYPLLDVDVLKAGHHGSKYATSEKFLECVSPELAVISCGRNNRYGHPARELLERLTDYGCRLARTDRQGAVTVQTDGKKWDIRTKLEPAG